MSSIKGIRNLTGCLLLKLVPHRKLNGRQVLCRKYFAKRIFRMGKSRIICVYFTPAAGRITDRLN